MNRRFAVFAPSRRPPPKLSTLPRSVAYTLEAGAAWRVSLLHAYEPEAGVHLLDDGWVSFCATRAGTTPGVSGHPPLAVSLTFLEVGTAF